VRSRVVQVAWVTLYFAVVGSFIAGLVVSVSMLALPWLTGVNVAASALSREWPVFSLLFLFISMAMFGVAVGFVPAGLVGFVYSLLFHSRPNTQASPLRKAGVAGILGLLVGTLFSRTFPTTPGFVLAGFLAGVFCSLDLPPSAVPAIRKGSWVEG
jgi:hypothetical protein